MKNLFIVFEGIDCSGKSTQASLLKEYFLSQNSQALLSPEPSSGLIGNLIREIMQKKKAIFAQDKKKFDEQMAYLFAADRYYHLYNEIDGVFKLINNHVHVITTRYYFSSLAYNCQTQEEFKFVSNLNKTFPNPDLVIYIDISIEEALTRLSTNRYSKDIYENKNKLTRVRENYQNIFTNYDGLLLTLNGTQEQDYLHKQIVDFINREILDLGF